MRISDWSSDVCSSDLVRSSSRHLSCRTCFSGSCCGHWTSTCRAAAAQRHEEPEFDRNIAAPGRAPWGSSVHDPVIRYRTTKDPVGSRLDNCGDLAIDKAYGDSYIRIMCFARRLLLVAVLVTYVARSEEHTSELQSLMRIP